MSTQSRLPALERFLSFWVLLAMAAGVAIGQFAPAVPQFLGRLEYARVSLPIAFLIWLMIFPMMLKIDFSSIFGALRQPKGLAVTLVTNWLVKPFTMFLIAGFFLNVVFRNLIPESLRTEYLAGAILLGAAPCTAMVFVWSHLTKGNPAYTLVQVAVNDLVLLLAYTPIAALLLGVSRITVPYDTLILSVVLFVVVPLTLGVLVRRGVIRKKGLNYLNNRLIPKFRHVTVGGLLLTLVIIFSFQGRVILSQPFVIALIAVPLVVQTFLIFGFAYAWAKIWKLPHSIASPAAMIGASNFFELSVAVAISLFGLHSGAALATVVGVLVEVPVMLTLVKISNRSRRWFNEDVLKLDGID